MYTRLNLLPKLLDPLTDHAFNKIQDEIWRSDEGNSPHGKPWHTSFHASRFPDSELGCPRAALYDLANFSDLGPANRKLVGQGHMGKAVELLFVEYWDRMGWLLSTPADAEYQLGAEDKESWLTCSFDSVLLLPEWNSPLPVEVKSKALERVQEMIFGQRGAEEKHILQLKVQMYFINKMGKEWWPDLKPVEMGILYYAARDDPSITKEFKVPYDAETIEQGLERLKQWNRAFQDDELIQTQEKKHPLGFKWSEPPCKWCPYKKNICKPDWQKGITKLSESHGIQYTKEVRESYDYRSTRKTVLDRWK